CSASTALTTIRSSSGLMETDTADLPFACEWTYWGHGARPHPSPSRCRQVVRARALLMRARDKSMPRISTRSRLIPTTSHVSAPCDHAARTCAPCKDLAHECER